MQNSTMKDIYYTTVVFIGDEHQRKYIYSTEVKYQPDTIVKETRTNTYAKVISCKFAYTAEREFQQDKITSLLANINSIENQLALSALGNRVVADALATYISTGTEDGENEDPISAAEIMSAIAMKVVSNYDKYSNNKAIVLPLTLADTIIVKHALINALQFYKLYNTVEEALEVAKILKQLGDSQLYQECQEYIINRFL